MSLLKPKFEIAGRTLYTELRKQQNIERWNRVCYRLDMFALLVTTLLNAGVGAVWLSNYSIGFKEA